jgi:hypothetical protein
MHAHADAQKDRTAELTPPIRPGAAWRLESVAVLPGYRLRARFNDGTEGTVEMDDFVHSDGAGVFAVLRDETVFGQASVVLGAVTWPGELDLAPDAMYREIREHGSWRV